MNAAPALQAATDWMDLCSVDDLVENAGISARVAGQQLAIFYIPSATPALYALDNFCPACEANVLARGIVGDLAGELVVASPLYKEHFRLATGSCVEKPLSVRVWPVEQRGSRVWVQSHPIAQPGS